MQPSRLAGILSNINRIIKRKTIDVTCDEILAVNPNRATAIYQNLNNTQRTVINKLSQDLITSNEFTIDSVIAYSVLKFFITGELWVFENEDLSILKSEIKKIFAQMSKKQYIKDINSIMTVLDDGSLTPKKLICIKDGSSLLYNLVLKNKLNIFAAAKLADWYDKADTEYESDTHKNFRKVLNIFSQLSY